MLDFQERVIKEQIDLGDKIEDLKTFMHGPVFAGLSSVNQGLLMIQLDHMQSYWNTLNRRIEIFVSKSDD